MRLETTILSQLIYNEDYCRKAIPFLQKEYFKDETERFVYNTIQKHIDDYNTLPTTEILSITVNQQIWEDREQLYDDVIEYIDNLINNEIDDIYEKALKFGALGGKLCGAGGGGFLMLYVKPENQESVRKGLSDFKELKFEFDYEGAVIL